MKKSVFLLALLALVSVTTTIAQNKKQEKDEAKEERELAEALSKVFKTKVDMDLDTTVFDSREGNMYVSETHKAFVMTMVAPQSIQKAEEKFNEPNENKKYKVIDKKKIEHEGRIILYLKSEAEKDGQKALIYIYQVEATPESTILISATDMGTDTEKIFKAVERAALTAKLGKE
jgi:hypothetical protein